MSLFLLDYFMNKLIIVLQYKIIKDEYDTYKIQLKEQELRKRNYGQLYGSYTV